MPFLRFLLTSFLTALLLLSLPSCHSKSAAVRTGWQRQGGKGHGGTTTVQPPDVSRLQGDARLLVAEAETWLGVPYRYGGTDRDGVDCSGFVQTVFSRALSLSLPRSSSSISDWCGRHVKRGDLEPGDLVFFDTSRSRNGGVSHVGLYVGEGTMIHSSTSRGVTYSNIDTDYYSGRFLSGGRVIAKAATSRRGKKGREEAAPASEPAPVTAPEPAPEPMTQPAPEPAPAPIAMPTPAPIAIPAPVSEPAPEPAPRPAVAAAPADARTAVLDRMIEQKLDSIYVTPLPSQP